MQLEDSKTVKITIILCTYNRCRSLAKALESAAASQLPDSVIWEVLVVDNKSSDQTREVVEEFCHRYPGRFRYLLESRQGKSNALNAGIREAQADILAFMDDDVTVEPTWLQNLTVSLHDGQWVGAGGRIRAERDFLPPRWLALEGRYSLGGVLVLFDRGDKAGQLDWAPYGTNMAFRKEMFEKYGGFRTDLGPNPGTEIRGEDTEFGRRLMFAGERVRYEPSAIVYHNVVESRIRKEYFLAWYFDFGRALVLERGRGRDICGIPRPYFDIAKTAATTMAKLTLRWIVAVRPQQRFFYKALVWRTAGELTESYRLARGKDSARVDAARAT
jgi:glucosyl-dolichyl phosphate glucuronosyltransferase